MAVERNTPTGVGKTLSARPTSSTRRKHPHGRGEDSASRMRISRHRETPPRAWGRPKLRELMDIGGGNTPTGVGKT